MSYREAAPSADVSHLVVSFWEFAVADKDFGMIEHEVFPDGCISLFYYRNNNFKIRRISFNTLCLESVTTPVFPGDLFWGMRISPAACANLLRENPANFSALKLIEAERFPHLTDGLTDKLDDCENFDEAIKVFENHLKELDFGRNFCDEKIEEALKIIEETSGEIKIAELAERLDLSPRQFERRFKAVSGLTPKQFVRARRIRATAVNLVENAEINWAERAAEMGFTDQSHLTHEFVSLTKRSPNSFAQKVSHIKHGKLVK